jgi:hypothetical protein
MRKMNKILALFLFTIVIIYSVAKVESQEVCESYAIMKQKTVRIIVVVHTMGIVGYVMHGSRITASLIDQYMITL